MDTSSIPVYGSLKRCWSTRGYRRLDVGFRKNKRVLRLGGKSRRRPWKIKAIPKLQLKIKFPVKIWRKLRDGYINMMLGFAGNVRYSGDNSVFAGKRIPRGRPIPQLSKYNSDEFDKRRILQIYNSLVGASRELVAFSSDDLS